MDDIPPDVPNDALRAGAAYAERLPAKSNPPELSPDDLSQLQKSYGDSCSKYERLADGKLHKSDTIIISGYGCALRVKNDALVIYPGKTHAAQTQATTILYRGMHSVKHIVLLSDKGVVSLDAVKWANEQDIAVMMLDGRGNLLLSLSTEHTSDAALRRMQYHASDTGQDITIARELVKRKIEAQIDVLKLLPDHPIVAGHTLVMQGKKVTLKRKGGMEHGDFIWKPLEDALVELPSAKEITTIQLVEAQTALTYWSCLVGIPIHWKASDVKKIPPHWKRVTKRRERAGSAQHATNPYQAVTNYAYALLQGQCKQALMATGFDTACGFIHADQLNRDSLVFDMMEPHRAHVDRLILHMFASHVLSKGEFMSTSDGSVQFNPQFARYIAATCRIEQDEIDMSAEWLKEVVMKR